MINTSFYTHIHTTDLIWLTFMPSTSHFTYQNKLPTSPFNTDKLTPQNNFASLLFYRFHFVQRIFLNYCAYIFTHFVPKIYMYTNVHAHNHKEYYVQCSFSWFMRSLSSPVTHVPKKKDDLSLFVPLHTTHLRLFSVFH